MKTKLTGNTLYVDTEGKKFYSETALWHALKLHLNKVCGMDMIKKVMAKDGHMVGGNEYPYYLRDRKWRFCVQDSDYMIRLLHKAESPIPLNYVEWDKHEEKFQ